MSQPKFMNGFGNNFSSEAMQGAVPPNQNSPQRHALGLYAEQFSGTCFTAPRAENFRSWLYRIRPSVMHSDWKLTSFKNWNTNTPDAKFCTPEQLRWNPLPSPQEKTAFPSGVSTFAVSGGAHENQGSAVNLYSWNDSMTTTYFFNADAEMLFVPQEGRLEFRTEFGIIPAEPLHIVLIPRGTKFQIRLLDSLAKGYFCENFGAHFRLPDLGPIGANGLAHSRHFETPVAWYEDLEKPMTLIQKFQSQFWTSAITHSPLNVVGWHGNYAPSRYDLRNFNTINTVSYDHPDPSIFTVLTSPSFNKPGTANVDFAIFPPRWMVAEKTFRPPYYHRNVMSEFMGLIAGAYDAKQGGFVPGGSSLHNCMSAHGPDTQSFEGASSANLAPHKIENTMAFMFESSMVYRPTQLAFESPLKQSGYLGCWQDLPKLFRG